MRELAQARREDVLHHREIDGTHRTERFELREHASTPSGWRIAASVS
jgi:hypothetical protein